MTLENTTCIEGLFYYKLFTAHVLISESYWLNFFKKIDFKSVNRLVQNEL